MKTIKIDILNKNVIKLLQSLDSLKLIRLHKEEKITKQIDFIKKYKGSVNPQPLSTVEQQLNELRKSWE